MKITHRVPMLACLVLAGLLAPARSDERNEVREKAFDAPHGVTIKVRMEGPYTADVPLQIVCYFKYTPAGAKRMTGAPVEMDKKLGGLIAALRERGEFVGDELETLLITPPKDSIPAKALLLVGLGDEEAVSLKVMERVGKVSLREAARLGVRRVAFAPLIRDQGNSKLGPGEVETAVLRGMLLALDTQKRLQNERLSQPFTLEEWVVEAGPAYFDDTVVGAQKGIAEATAAAAKRNSDRYSTKSGF